MRHVILTCKNHPNLRWSTKAISFTDEGGYNGERNIFFKGVSKGKMYDDLSGLDCTTFYEGEIIKECSCPASDLIRAPEDILVKR